MANPATAPMQAAIATFQLLLLLLFTTGDPLASVLDLTRTVARPCQRIRLYRAVGNWEPFALPGHSRPRGQAHGRAVTPRVTRRYHKGARTRAPLPLARARPPRPERRRSRSAAGAHRARPRGSGRPAVGPRRAR